MCMREVPQIMYRKCSEGIASPTGCAVVNRTIVLCSQMIRLLKYVTGTRQEAFRSVRLLLNMGLGSLPSAGTFGGFATEAVPNGR